MREGVMITLTIEELKCLVRDAVTEANAITNKASLVTPIYKYLNTVEAAQFLGKTPNALRVMVCKDQIKSIKKDNRLHFREADLIEYLESGKKSTKAELSMDCEAVLKQQSK